MSTEQDRNRKALAVRPASPDYEVGYAKPPVESRFKPGQSGNPRGRPKGSKNRPMPPELYEERLKAIILEEAYRIVTINDAKGPVSIPIAQAVIRSLAVNAAKGNQRAQRHFTEVLGSVEADNKRLNDEHLQAAFAYKVEWQRELERCARLGVTGPEPVPHPDHVIIDLDKGTAYIRGPRTREEKQQLDVWRQYKKLFEEELEELGALRDDPAYHDQAGLLEEISKTESVLEIIGVILAAGRIPEEFPVLEPLDTSLDGRPGPE